ncbi:MAG TPA: OmpA family protein [Acidimicrobiales bacterium]
MLAAVVAVLAAGGPAAAQEDGGGRRDDRGGQGSGHERTAELRFRVVDLAVRTGATDDSELTTQTPDRTTVVYAADVMFDFDRSDLNAEARRRIDELADQLAELGPRTVTIEGHTDNRGTADYNRRLSQRRAEAVRARLAIQLDERFRLEATGYGETRPIADNRTPEGQARNRRVTVSYPTD